MDARRRRWGFAAIAVLGFAYAFLIQPTGDNQKAHYALVRALADGRATVDEVRTNPNLRTIDVTEHDGHLYAAKSPGFALFSLPAYVVLDRAGVDTAGDTRRILWALHLWGTVLPALVLLLLVRWVADDVQPGMGIAAAATLGTATLVLPFATLYFSHVLAAALAFACFALLLLERKRAPRLAFVAGAGLLAGLAVTTETSAAVAGIVLGFYALARAAPRVARGAAFATGVVAGVVPALVFNWWALGSPLRSPYEGWHYPGQPVASSTFGFSLPTPRSLLVVLLYPTGLVLLAAGIAGAIVLVRRQRAEGIAILATAAGFVLANSMARELLGGASPGPRYLIPVFPFLAVGLAVAYKEFPGETVGLALAGAAMLGAATITSPLGAFDQHVIQRLRSHSVVRTALEFVGIRSGFAVLVFVAAVVVAMFLAARTSELSLSSRQLGAAVFTAAAFAVVATQVPRLLDTGSPPRELALAVLIVVAAIGAVLLTRRLALDVPSAPGTMEAERAP
jgi:4-amino-4-deoxy-L-arabinose transferase-like glycosyltransferase